MNKNLTWTVLKHGTEPFDHMAIFGRLSEWGVSVDDGCLRFHPNIHDDPSRTSSWVWKEAWDYVEENGGYDEMIKLIRAKR